MRVFLADLVSAFLRLVTRIFFRTVEVTGLENVPREGAVVVAGNHPNSLLDPILVLTTLPRRVRFAAKEPLFRSPLRPLLWLLGAVPVKRRQDAVEGAREDGPVEGAPARVDNSAAFTALTDVLAAGFAFCIFPEGISHTRPGLAPLKTGAARIALRAAASGVDVVVVPVGLSYRHRDRMRSRVLVQYGAPVTVQRDAAIDEQEQARALTDTLATALRAQTIDAPDFETLRVLDGVRRLYRPPGHELRLTAQAELMRRFLAGWARHHDDVEVRGVYDDTRSYLDEVRALGLVDDQLQGGLTLWEKALHLMRHVVFLAVLVPIAAPGLLLHLPLLATAVAASRTLTSRGDVRATIQIVVATVATLLLWCAVAAAVAAAVPGPRGVLTACAVLGALLLSGAAALRVLDGHVPLRRGLFTLVALTHLDRELAALRARRDALRTRIVAVVDRFADPALPRVVAPEHHGDARAWLDDDDGL